MIKLKSTENERSHDLSAIISIFLVAIIFCALTLSFPAVAAASFWDTEPEPEKVTLDSAVSTLCEKLVDQAGLVRGKPVLISTNDFFDANSGLSLPLAVQLRGKFITNMKRQGARVLLPGSDEDKYLILQGTWQREGKFLGLDIKIMGLNSDGPEVVAAASSKILLKRIDERALVADLDSWGRYLVRKLENRVRNRKRHTVYLRKFRPKGELNSHPDLALYLADWMRPALAESNLFRVLDPQLELRNLEVGELRTRGLGQDYGGSVSQNGNRQRGSLTADLLRSDSELWGSAWLNHDDVEVRASILDLTGQQVTAAKVSVPKSLLPSYLVATAAAETVTSKSLLPQAEENISRGGLKVEISTDRGEDRPLYFKGEQIRFLIRINRDAWVYIFYLNPDKSALPLYPLDNRNQPVRNPAKLKANRLLVLPDDGCPYDLKVSPPFGRDQVLVIASEKQISLPKIESSDWQSADKLFSRLRNQVLKDNLGYAEAQIVVESKIR